MTNRQLMAWQSWLNMELNRPSRADYHVMRVAQTMGGGNLEKYRVKFQTEGDTSALTVEELTQRAKAATAASLGISLPDQDVSGTQQARYMDSPQRDTAADAEGSRADRTEEAERVRNQWQSSS